MIHTAWIYMHACWLHVIFNANSIANCWNLAILMLILIILCKFYHNCYLTIPSMSTLQDQFWTNLELKHSWTTVGMVGIIRPTSECLGCNLNKLVKICIKIALNWIKSTCIIKKMIFLASKWPKVSCSMFMFEASDTLMQKYH